MDAVSGTFAKGLSIVVGPYTFVINYAGGDGNDVVLGMCTGFTTITTPTLVVENTPMLPASVPDVGMAPMFGSSRMVPSPAGRAPQVSAMHKVLQAC